MIASLLATVVISTGLATPAPPVLVQSQSILLKRVYEAKETDRYTITADIAEGGQEFSIIAELTVTTKKVFEDGAADVRFEETKMSIVIGGQEMEDELHFPIQVKCDLHGMPAMLDVEEEGRSFVVFAITGFVPAKEVKVGDKFKVQWTSPDKNASVTGNGKLTEMTEIGGRKVAKLEYEVEAYPNTEDPGYLKFTSYVDVENGKLVKAEGSVSTEEMEASFKITLVK
ncbi:MAG: hypothetical protein IH851_06795 [Armatimonadetes bacterium]|nr:hypothetical protein [Armatimonadota bacterium]